MSRRSTLLPLLVAACANPPPPAAPCPIAPAPAPVATAPVTPAAPPTAPAPAPAGPSGYDKPPQNVLDVLHAPSNAQPLVSPTRTSILLVSWVTYPPIAQVAEPYLRLAGVRVEPRTRRKHDTPGGYGVAPCAQTLAITDVATGKDKAITLPAGGCADGMAWSNDGARFAFRNTSTDAVELWVGDTSGAVHRLGAARLNPMLGSSLQWLADNKTLLVKLVPDTAGAPPAGGAQSDAPGIQETNGEKGEFSTYEARDTLASKHDEDLFTYYATTQLAFVDAQTGRTTPLGRPAIVTDVAASPDAKSVLVSTIKKPFSYATTFENFAHDVEVWNVAGNVVATIAKLPVADRVPIEGVPTGPRAFGWRATDAATLVWAEALDGGDWNAKVPARDKVMMQAAPFTEAPAEIARLEQRYEGLIWGEKRNTALLREIDENKHWRRTFLLDADARAKPALLFDMSSQERYKYPGDPVYRMMPNGQWAMRQDGDAVFLRGQGASTEGDRPFLDRLDLKTKKTERLFRSDKTSLESFIAFLDDTGASFMTWRQSPKDPPNAELRVLGAPIAGAPAGEPVVASTVERAITHIPDPVPAVRGVKQRLVKYKRKDGTQLSFTLLTPPGYVEGTRIPAILYAYPLDYASTAAAGQVSGSEQVFMRVTDYRLLLMSGYAIIDNAAFPIVGDPKKAYDTYLPQLVEDAQAAVDTAVATGVVDRDRIGVTGHSHGALMTANLIAHTKLFKAGVATSGSYNKTLTPFGFQNERRSVWKSPEVYKTVSPFFVADKITLPLLIMHGAEDANPGTTPLQAVKLFEAIRGNGGTARLVMLPHEPHWYSAMESNEQLAYEELRWFDKYVKNAAK